MKKIIIILLIFLIISVGLNIYFIIINRVNMTKSNLEGKYEGGKTYYNYNDDKEYIRPEDSFDFSYIKTNNTLTFYKNGTMTYNNFRGTYTFSPKMHTVTFSFMRNNYEETYTFEVSNDLKILKATNKNDNTGTTNGERNPYYIEEYILKD